MRPIVERLITVAKRGVKAAEPKGRTLAAKRLVKRDIVERRGASTKLFDQLAPRFMERPGGYTRILRLGHRRGDGGEIAQIELLGSEYDPKKAEAEKAEQEAAAEAPKQKSVGERLRAAAQNLRGEEGRKPRATRPAPRPSKPATRRGEEDAPRRARPAGRRTVRQVLPSNARPDLLRRAFPCTPAARPLTPSNVPRTSNVQYG